MKLHNKLYLVCLGCWLMVCSLESKAQLPYTRAINYPYQITTKTIYDMYDDAKGQIWLGTNQGLMRFNGKSAYTLPFEGARQTDFTHLKTDAYGRIWGMNFANQLAYVSRDSLKIFQFPADLSLKGSLLDFDFTPQCLWLCTDKMVVAIHLKTRKVLYRYEESLDMLFTIKAYQNKIYVLRSGETLVFDDQGTMQNVYSPINTVGRFAVSGETFIAAKRENFKRDACQWKEGKWLELPTFEMPSDITIYHLTSSRDGQIWFCTKQGGWKWDIKTGKTQNLFPNLQVTDIVSDYQGNYWISTLDDGLWFCPSLQSLIAVPIPELEEKNVYITRIQKHLRKPNDYWIATANGRIYRSSLKATENPWYFESEFKKEVTALAKGRNDDEILSTLGILNTHTKKQIAFPYPKDLQLYDNQYLLLGRSAVAEWVMPYYDSNAPPPKTLFGLPLNPTISLLYGYPSYTIRTQRSYGVCIDSLRKRYWIGYADDLYEYDFQGNVKIIKNQEGKAITARKMCTDKEGRLYVATYNQGLYVIENRKVSHVLDKSNLLKSNEVQKVINYQDTIWIGTRQEIGYLWNNNQSLRDVLGENRIGSINYQDFIPDKGVLLIALGYKILYLPRNSPKKVPDLNLLYPKVIQKDNNVEIHLEMLNYTNPEHSRFYYRLVGIDKKWNITDDIKTTIRYSQLNAGDYSLEFYAQDQYSLATSKPTTVQFLIPKKWWERNWIYALAVVGLIGLLASIFYAVLKRYQKRQDLKEQLWISQLKAIKAQMNPHFLYNILNTVQGLVYSNRKGEAAELLGKFSDLMRKALESSEIPYLPLEDEINTLRLYLHLEKSRFEGQDFEFEIEDTQAEALLEHKIPSMLVQPFVENAIKHGLLHKNGTKRLKISFQAMHSGLKVLISDNGIGREKAAQIRQRQAQHVQHFTMNATQQRIDLLNKIKKFHIDFKVNDKYDTNQHSIGTEVEIFIQFLNLNQH